jgi:predicted membrane metal-binding protein
MFWPWLFIFLMITQFHIRFSIVSELQDMSLFLHNLCLLQIPNSSTTRATLSALVCGKNFERLSDTQIYSSTGLIHLFVVSGSHLILIQKFLTKISSLFTKKWPTTLLMLFLMTYAAMCLFNPPVTRSFIFLFMTIVLHQKHQYWPKHYLLLLAGLLTLCLNYQWVTSLSLQMSWLAALVLEIYTEKFKSFSFFFRQILFYGLFIVCFMGLGFPQFSTIVLCVLLTPVLEYILFPFAILTVIIHPLEPLFAGLLSVLNMFLSALEFSSRASYLEIPTVSFINWVLIFICHFLLFFRKPRS